MYGIDMKYTVKTLLSKGLSQRAISKELGISRKTVKKYFEEIQNNNILLTPKIEREKILDVYKSDIEEWLSSGLTGVLILEKLNIEQKLNVSYPTVSRFLKQFKTPEVYIPLIAKPGEEAQVDFGYLGKFIKDGKNVKVWCFSMVLSHSRYAYHCLVTNQSISSFIWCHINAFEYFGGVPLTVKIDNLKTGVSIPNFYEPTIQRQYAEFLEYYGSAPITARIKRGQDKGKVEAGVKYVKNNFLKRIEHKCFYQLEKDLLNWTNNICNKRLHGTTKKVPFDIFMQIESTCLKQLPNKRYEIFKIEQRKVNNYGHVSFKDNFYSVPYNYIGKLLTIKSTDSLIKIYDDINQVAIHSICSKKGEFISKQEHKPPEKQRKTEQEYSLKAIKSGDSTYEFFKILKEIKPFSWNRIMQGIFSLQINYSTKIVDSACKRALEYSAISYTAVKNICKNNLYDKPIESLSIMGNNEFAHNLKQYDNLFNI
jgi:transposase